MARETFGQKISALRKAQGWSQEYVADKLGITQQGYSRYETDDIIDIPASKLAQFCALFRIPPEEFLALLQARLPEESVSHA